MFGLFKKIATDDAWINTAEAIRPNIRVIGKQLRVAGFAIRGDLIYGWEQVADTLLSLDGIKAHVKDFERKFKDVGEPAKGSPLTPAHQALKEFFTQFDIALRMGKYHYQDASSGPGDRARYETGIARRAAIARLTFNGTMFSGAAIQASEAANTLEDILTGC